MASTVTSTSKPSDNTEQATFSQQFNLLWQKLAKHRENHPKPLSPFKKRRDIKPIEETKLFQIFQQMGNKTDLFNALRIYFKNKLTSAIAKYQKTHAWRAKHSRQQDIAKITGILTTLSTKLDSDNNKD